MNISMPSVGKVGRAGRLCVFFVAFVALPAIGGVVVASAAGLGSDDVQSVTRCADLKRFWGDAHEVFIDHETDTVVLRWGGDSEDDSARLANDDLDCSSQKGLAEQIETHVANQAAAAQSSCLDLRQLAQGLRAADPTARGRVVVPAELDEAILSADSEPLPEDAPRKWGPGAPEHTVDLDEIDRVLEQSCTK